MSQPQYQTASISLKGNRKKNQDKCVVLESEHSALLALADGMGGSDRGEMAARILMNTSRRLFEDVGGKIKDPTGFLSTLLHEAHLSIIDFGRSQSPTIDPRTTAVVALVQDGVVHWAHVGDSRLYLFRNQRIIARTVDHSYVEDLYQQGIISSEQRALHPQRNYLTRCLGGTPSKLDITFDGPAALRTGDTLVLCSDGLWGQFNEHELGFTLSEVDSIKRVTNILAHKAEALAYPESDNVSIVSLRWFGDDALTPVNDKPRSPWHLHAINKRERSDEEVQRSLDELRRAVATYEDQTRREQIRHE